MGASDGIIFLFLIWMKIKIKKLILKTKSQLQKKMIKNVLSNFQKMMEDIYIIILAMNILYFFYPDGTLINSFSFTEEAEHYCINPY